MNLRPIQTLCLAGALLAGSIAAVSAQSKPDATKGPGASQFTPPHSSTNVPPGQGGTAPGQMMNDERNKGTTGQRPGASQFAPPHSKTNEPPGLGGTPPGQKMNDNRK